MDLVTKISSLVACVQDTEEVFDRWYSIPNAPIIPSYWKKKGQAAVLKSFGSNGTVIDLKAYTALLGSKVDLKIKGWIATDNTIVLVVDPKSLPTDLANPYLILAMSSDLMDYELVINKIKRSKINSCSFTIGTKIGYRDKYRRMVRFDIPEELE